VSNPNTTILAPEPRDGRMLRTFRSPATTTALLVGVIFVVAATVIMVAGRRNCVYRRGEHLAEAVHARVDFAHRDASKLAAAQHRARDLEPRVYRPNPQFSFAGLMEQMRQWPEIVATRQLKDLPEGMRGVLDQPAAALLAQYNAPERKHLFNQRLEAFFTSFGNVILVPQEQRDQEMTRHQQFHAPTGFALRVMDGSNGILVPLEKVHAARADAALAADIARAAGENFREDLAPRIAQFVINSLAPTHLLDESATMEAQTRAASLVPPREGEIQYKAGMAILQPGEIDERDLGILQAENRAYYASLSMPVIVRDTLGILGILCVTAGAFGWYIRKYQQRILRNNARAFALMVLVVGMLLLSQLAASGTRPLYLFGLAPTILTAMILAIAYDPRFALGVSLILACLTTLGLNQSAPFLLTLMAGCTTCCAMVGTVRTRGRLIEIGFFAAIVMIFMTMFSAVLISQGAQPFGYILDDCMYVALAGLGSGFVVLGVMPLIERTFRITTGMTLLELSDPANPLQRKLAAEAPGTYSHSMQVAALAEAAAEAISANSLLARVGALYHDIGKTHRPHYFCENQGQSENAHLALSPNVSFMIIVEHIKDGIELARQYNLPTHLHPFIQQHHGTTLVEFFYHEACKQQGGAQNIQEDAFRYPGPKPRSREIAIVMLADACESATRSMDDPTPESIFKLVHNITRKRLLDGQLSECDLTLRELDEVEKTLVRTLQSIHHNRIAYPDRAAAAPALSATGS
jgi:putative nucleotidyltransferase with HDIG domain